MSESLQQKLARLRTEREAKEASSLVPQFDPDLVPDVGPVTRSDESVEIDRALDGLNIVDAYVRWCGKSSPKGDKTESIMVSCPDPAHPDKNPSAWLNSDKGTWFCGGCQKGGDRYDVAAWHFGYPVPGYKNKDIFPELRRRMAADLGVTIIKTPSGRSVAVATPQPEPKPEPEPVSPAEARLAPVLAFPETMDADPFASAQIDWKALVPEDTFLHEYMEMTSRFDLPEEYHFWLGLQLIATAAGDTVVMRENPNIKGNLFVCLVGPSGIGKSRATRMQQTLCRAALPYDYDDPNSTGTHIAPTPGSGESLLDIFSKVEYDPTDPKKILGYRQVRGLVNFDEMATLASKADRAGSTMKPSLMGLYDGGSISQRSRASGLIVVESPFCQVTATTQPRSLRQVLAASDADSGFINRWVFAAGPAKKLDAYRVDGFDPAPLVPSLQKLRSWASRYREYSLRGDALAMWTKFFHKELEPVKQAVDEVPLLTRADLTLRKVMLQLAINERSEEILPKHVERALALWPYLKITYGAMGAQIGVGEVDDCGAAIMEHIKMHVEKRGKPPSIRDLHDGYLKRRYQMKTMTEAIRLLVTLEQITELMPPAGSKGRPTVRYALNA